MITVALLLLANPPTSSNAQQVPSNTKPMVACQQSGEQSTNGNGSGDYPSSYGAASELQKQIERSNQCLSQPDVRSAYGTDDQWQEVDRRNSEQANGKAGKKAVKSGQSANDSVPKP